jgi:hypothetical protein
MIVALFIAASIASSFLLLGRRALRHWIGIVVAAWVLFGALAVVARPLGVIVDPYVAFVAFGVGVTAAFWAFVSSADDVRWSATRAALAAALFYTVAIPLMLRTPIDGDEPYYLLMTESLVRDHDLDLANQYRDLAHSASGRTDLAPQLGDPVGAHGERYSRHEPFLALLLIPGYRIGRLPGAIATIVIFGALLARSTVRLFEDEGIDDRTIRALFPFIAFGPPIVFYAARIWPEVPAAFCFVEALRGVRQRRALRWIPALLALVLLKLRFLFIAVVLLARLVWDRRSRLSARAGLPAPHYFVAALLIIAVPIVVVWSVSGSATNVHAWRELIPGTPAEMARGLFGLLLDGAAGILFQAPIYLFGIIALARWRTTPAAFRLGMSSAALYVLYLLPRSEWHGGWSPPLRYLVVLMPILALGVASIWERIAIGPIVVTAAWTMMLVVHGMSYPWRLFHIANGENFVGETLSSIWQSDFSRLFPSFIRPNFAAIVGSVIAVLAIVMFRSGRLASPALFAAVIAAAFVIGRRPGDRIEFEDAHVIHRGGELYPYEFQVARFAFRGGWIVRAGDTLSFLARGGPSTLRYAADMPAMIQLGAAAYALPPTHGRYQTIRVEIPRNGRMELRCLSGAVNLDRMDHD